MGQPPTEVAWNVDTLRSTVLFSPARPYAPRPLWPILLPGVRTYTERGDGSIEEAGAFEGFYLTITQTPVRVDIVWHEGRDRWNQERLEAAANRLPNIGPFGGPGNTAFDDFLHRFLEISGIPARLAYAPILSIPVANQADGYRIVAEKVRVELDPERVSDFQFQINRWRDSTEAPGARINRLTRWSVMQLVRLQVAGEGALAQVRQAVLAQAARVEMDVNVLYEDGRVLEGVALRAIVNELIEAVVELAREGDRP